MFKVIVTGEPRSGTSLMMQTLRLLGCPVTGKLFPKKVDKSLNPGGFFEIPKLVMRGVQDPSIVEKYNNKAIKIVSSGCVRTPTEFTEKYILCLRNPESVAQSQTKLESNFKVAGVAGWESPYKQANPKRFIIENGTLLKWWQQNPQIKILVVDYDELIEQSRKTINEIIRFLGLETITIRPALNNINPGLRRSPSAFKGWQDPQLGQQATDLYSALLNKQFSSKVLTDTETLITQTKKESRFFYDKELGAMGNQRFHDELKNNSTLRTKWLEGTKKEILKGMHPFCSPDYEEPNDTREYKLETTSQTLKRKLVKYRGKNMTYEAAFVLHQRLWAKGEANILPLADRKRLAS